MPQYPETLGFQPLWQAVHQNHILKAAAGERHGRKPAGLSRRLALADGHLDQGVVKARGDAPGLHASIPVGNHGVDHLTPVKAQGASRKRDGVDAVVFRSRSLQQYRALALVAAARLDAKDGRYAVKEPAHAGGQGAVEPRVKHLRIEGGVFHRAGVQPRLPQQREGHTVGLLRRAVAADEGDGPDGTEAFKSGIAADEALPTPDGAVRAETRAVPDKADRLALISVVRKARGQVGVVVLNRDQGQVFFFRPFPGVLRGEIIRVQIAGQRLRGDIKQPFKMGDLSGIVIQRLQVFQIPDMLAWEDLAVS